MNAFNELRAAVGRHFWHLPFGTENAARWRFMRTAAAQGSGAESGTDVQDPERRRPEAGDARVDALMERVADSETRAMLRSEMFAARRLADVASLAVAPLPAGGPDELRFTHELARDLDAQRRKLRG